MPAQFLEILFTKDVQPNDLEIIQQAQPSQPGLARLNQATIGPTRPEAPNSAPLKSKSGATIGFVASLELMAAPYSATYRIAEN